MLHSPYTYLETNCYNFSFFFVFTFSLSWNFWSQLGGEYASFAFLVYVWLNLNKREDKILLLRAPDGHRIKIRAFGFFGPSKSSELWRNGPLAGIAWHMHGQIPLKRRFVLQYCKG